MQFTRSDVAFQEHRGQLFLSKSQSIQPFSNSHSYSREDVPLRKVLGSERKLYSGVLGQRAMTWKCPPEEQPTDVLLFQTVSFTGTVSFQLPLTVVFGKHIHLLFVEENMNSAFLKSLLVVWNLVIACLLPCRICSCCNDLKSVCVCVGGSVTFLSTASFRLVN